MLQKYLHKGTFVVLFLLTVLINCIFSITLAYAADDAPALGVIKSVFNGSTNADDALTVEGNPTTPRTSLPLTGEYAEIYVRAPKATEISSPWYGDAGKWSSYTTSRPGFEPYAVETTTVTASTSSQDRGYQYMADGLNPADYVWARTKEISSTNKEGAFEFQFSGLKPTPVDNPAIIYFHVTMQGRSSDPANTGGNTTHNFWVGYKVHVLPAEGSTNETPAADFWTYLDYNAMGGTVRGKDVYRETKTFDEKPALLSTTDFPIIEDIPTKDGYTFKYWYYANPYFKNSYTYYAHTLPAPVPEGAVAKDVYAAMWTSSGKGYELKAAWAQSYGLSYDANGGEHAPADALGDFGVNADQSPKSDPVELVVGAAPERAGYVFAGWKYEDKVYQPGDTIELTVDAPFKTLVAQWNKEVEPVEPEEPTQPEEPEQPVQPAEPEEPSEPVEPSDEPHEPEQGEKPELPQAPVEDTANTSHEIPDTNDINVLPIALPLMGSSVALIGLASYLSRKKS